MRLVVSTLTAALLLTTVGATAQASSVSPQTSAVGAVSLPTAAPGSAEHDRTVSDVPASWTPRILDGRTYDIAQVGDTMVVGGDFSQVAPSSGSPAMNRANVFAFNATNGQINSGFSPVPDGEVRAVEPGPTPGTVYIGGAFKGINGVSGKVLLVNVDTGSVVSSFNVPAMNGAVQDLQRIDNRLYVAGVFTKVGGQPHGGLVALNATTGARESFLSVNLTENHNYTGQAGQARAPVGAKAFAVDRSGTQMSVVGNFKKADGLDRDQMVMIDLTGSTATVRADWRTRGYEATCASRAFDTYMRDIDFAPDGSYVTVATTGGPFSGTLCDTVTRWDVANTGQDLKPDWIDPSGGDTYLSVATSGAAIYTGGHQRWMNNPNGRDSAGAGAVPRPGLGAMDPENGVPVSWNPGRNPRGVGAEAITVTDAGVWVGSDTEFIGDFRYRRPRLAFFPLQGGIQQGPGKTGDLPSNVYLVNNKSADSNVLFRVNAAGPELPSFDGGPSWAADNFTESPFRNSGNNAATYSPVPSVGSEVPSGTPSAIFDSERWDPSSGDEMSWNIPVTDGEDVSVRLYFANRCGCTNDPGERVFDVDLEGTTVLNDYDISADVGHDKGTVKEFDVTSDGNIDIDFRHMVENPLINGIEIVANTPDGEPMADGPGLSRLYYEGGAATGEPQAAPSGDIDWADVRGAVVIDGELFYGTKDRDFIRRSFDGEQFGDPESIDPYNDPAWSDVETGSGSSVYRGVKPSFYNDIAGIVGMAYQDDYLYYTRSGSSALYSRAFVPESGVISDKAIQVPGFNASNAAGIFFDQAGDTLYFANSANGTLSTIGWTDGAVSGTPTVVSGPDIDGVDWRTRVLFLGAGPEPVVNQTPTADIADPSCAGLVCDFDGSGSSDPDAGDSIASYAWDFGDDETGTGATPSHEFAAAGSYDVTLTVTDQDGAEGSTTVTVEVEAAPVNEAPEAVIADPSCAGLVCDFDGSGSSDPDAGDSIASYAWDFGDDETGTGATPSHEFAAAGSYDVTLTVTDQDGAEGSTTVTVEVEAAPVNAAPEAVIADPSCAGLVCDFDGSGSSDPDAGDSIASYAWDFGDDETGTGATPSHEFAAAGSYDVTLTVTDQDGAEGSTTVTVEVEAAPVNAAPEAVIADPSCAGLVCDFDGSGSSDPDAGDSIASYAWDFGDDETGTGATPSHEFAAAGSYDVTLTVTDQDGAEGSTTVTVEVVEDPVVTGDAPELVGQDAVNGRSKTPSVVVPGNIEEGDLMLLLVSSQSNEVLNDPTGVEDWTKEERVTSGSLGTTVFSHIADGSEAGEAVGLTFGRYRKTDVTLLVYRGLGSDPIESIEATSLRNQTSHSTPAVQIAGDNRTVLSYWADRSSTTTQWTAPSDVDVVSTQVGAGSARVSTLIVQETPEQGAYEGLTAKTNAPSSRSMAMTIVLAP